MDFTAAVRTIDADIRKLETARRSLRKLAKISTPDRQRRPKQARVRARARVRSRVMSIQARKRIARAQKVRWAKWHKEQKEQAYP